MRVVCAERLPEVEFNLRRGTTTNSYLLKASGAHGRQHRLSASKAVSWVACHAWWTHIRAPMSRATAHARSRPAPHCAVGCAGRALQHTRPPSPPRPRITITITPAGRRQRLRGPDRRPLPSLRCRLCRPAGGDGRGQEPALRPHHAPHPRAPARAGVRAARLPAAGPAAVAHQPGAAAAQRPRGGGRGAGKRAQRGAGGRRAGGSPGLPVCLQHLPAGQHRKRPWRLAVHLHRSGCSWVRASEGSADRPGLSVPQHPCRWRWCRAAASCGCRASARCASSPSPRRAGQTWCPSTARRVRAEAACRCDHSM